MSVQYAYRAGGNGDLLLRVDEAGHAYGDAVKRGTLLGNNMRERLVEGLLAVDRSRDRTRNAHAPVLEHHVSGEERSDFERKDALLCSHIVI